MNTMTTTAQSANHTAQDDRNAFLPSLLSKLFDLFCLSAAVNSIDTELLAHHIVIE